MSAPFRSLLAILIVGIGLSTGAVALEPHPDLADQHAAISALYMEERFEEGIELCLDYMEAWAGSHGTDSAEYCSMASDLGPLYTRAGRWEEGGIAHREGIECLRRTHGPDHHDLAIALNNYGIYLGGMSDFARSELAISESIRIYRSDPDVDPVSLAISLHNLGVNQQDQGNDVAAERNLRESLEILRTHLGEEHSNTATAKTSLGRLLAELDQHDEAAPLLQAALDANIAELGEEHSSTAISRRELGRVQLFRGDPVAAETTFRAALAGILAGPSPTELTISSTRHELARALKDQGRLSEARAELEIARSLYEKHLEQGNAKLVMAAVELGEIAMAEQKPEEAASHFAAAAEAFESTRTQVGAGLNRATWYDNPWPHVAASNVLARNDAQAWEALNNSHGRVLAEVLFPEDSPRPDLPAGTAMLGWLDVDLGDGPRAWTWLLRDGDVRWYPLAHVGEHAAAIGSFREALASPGPLGGVTRLARDVQRLRLEPAMDDLAGLDHLVVVPDGRMQGVPIGALVDEQGRWLADTWSISYAPSPAVYAWLQRHPPRSDGPGLFVGDPMLSETAPDLRFAALDSRRPSDDVIRGASNGQAEALAALPPLPGTRLEVQELAGTWPEATTLLGAEAQESAFITLAATDHLRDFNVLHFATHALVDPSDAYSSALVLSQVGLPDPLDALSSEERLLDGLVTSGEIIDDWALDADLVVLSACNSALGRAVAGEGLVGFAHAFLRVGARSTLVSQWSVPDLATRRFMSAFYDVWHGQSASRAQALAAARRTLRAQRDDAGRLAYEHPYYWAPFVLVGDDR